MIDKNPVRMISSKELLAKTGISRATLNNYINLGILSKPQVRQPSRSEDGARLLGFFPDDSMERIELVQQYKSKGLSMADIVSRVREDATRRQGSGSPDAQVMPIRPALEHSADTSISAAERRSLQLTIDEIPHPAYMVNHNFELGWYNDAARQHFLGNFESLPATTEARNVFALLLEGSAGFPEHYRNDLLRLHVMLARTRLSRSDMMNACRDLGRESSDLIESLYRDVEQGASPMAANPPVEWHVGDEEHGRWHVYAMTFREGILLVYVAGGPASASLLDFLARRDVVIRNLLRRRLPVLTQLAVLVSDLQNSVKICSELPPEEYFELINEIWATMGPIFRRYYGTHGKHVGDGMVYYFFPQPDSHYVFNALACSHEIRLAMRRISKDWQLRKNWLNELCLNTGLHEGQEWLGTFQSATSIEFAVLGDTINHAARLSDFARHGAIWATKNFVGKLDPEQRARVEFGIARRTDDREHFVMSSYSQLGSLVDLSAERYEKLREIATLPITEIRGVRTSD